MSGEGNGREGDFTVKYFPSLSEGFRELLSHFGPLLYLCLFCAIFMHPWFHLFPFTIIRLIPVTHDQTVNLGLS